MGDPPKRRPTAYCKSCKKLVVLVNGVIAPHSDNTATACAGAGFAGTTS